MNNFFKLSEDYYNDGFIPPLDEDLRKIQGLLPQTTANICVLENRCVNMYPSKVVELSYGSTYNCGKVCKSQ